MPEKITFPKDFVIGSATAAYQNEGGAFEDGKGLSIWDDFTHRKGKVEDGTTGDIACDHYHRYVEDIELMREIKHDGYRFSISWPRIFPQGTGQINTKGLDFYDRLVDELLKKGIEPYITLYHWDLPLALEKKGGWLKRETAYDFADYAEIVVNRLGDRAKKFITINEPFTVLIAGYLFGMHPPCQKDFFKGFKAAHNLLLAHGLGVQRIKAIRPDVEVGITNILIPSYAHTPEDTRTAERAEAFLVGLFMDPIFKGHYPTELEKMIHIMNPSIRSSDFDIISLPTDFVGVNYYNRYVAKKSLAPFLGFSEVKPDYPGKKLSSKGWEFYPQGLYDLLIRVKERYGNPKMYVTENGVSLNDKVEDGKVHDADRIEYLKGHLASVNRAIQAGANVNGYFYWSSMDNFDWEKGLLARFGLIYCDFDTQQRIIKDSGLWLKDVCTSRHFEI